MKSIRSLKEKIDSKSLTYTEASMLCKSLELKDDDESETIRWYLESWYIPNVKENEELRILNEDKRSSVTKELASLRFFIETNLARDAILRKEIEVENLCSELSDLGYRFSIFNYDSKYLDLANALSLESLELWINYLRQKRE